MWKDITRFEKSLKGPEHDSGPFLYDGKLRPVIQERAKVHFFFSFCDNFMEKAAYCHAILTLSCGSWKGIEMGKEENSTACFDLFWKK